MSFNLLLSYRNHCDPWLADAKKRDSKSKGVDEGSRSIWPPCHVVFASFCCPMTNLQTLKVAGIHNFMKHSLLFWAEAVTPGDYHSGNGVTFESFAQIMKRGRRLGRLAKAGGWGLVSFCKKGYLGRASPVTYIPKHLHSSHRVRSLHPKPISWFVVAFILWFMPSLPWVVSLPSLRWPKSFASLKTQLILYQKVPRLSKLEVIVLWLCTPEMF